MSTPLRPSLRISSAYFAFGACWILLSDLLLMSEFSWSVYLVSSFKGIFFIFVSAILIFLLLHRHMQRVQQANAIANAVVDATPDAVVVRDLKGNCLLLNLEAANRLAGKPMKASPTESTRQRARIRQLTHQNEVAIAENKTVTFEETEEVEGTLRTFQVTSVPFSDSKQQPIGVITLSHDITDWRTQEQLLRAERDRFEQLVRTVPVVICSFQKSKDGSYTFPYCSPQIELIYGVTPEKLKLSADPVFKRLSDEDRSRIFASIEASARTMTLWREEYRVNSPRLGEIWVEGCSVPKFQPDGTIRWEGYIADVTQRRRDQEQKRLLEEQLVHSQKMEAIGRLAGGIAHDFNNLLTVIQGSCDELIDKATYDENSVTAIQASAQRAAQLTHQLLALGRRSITQRTTLDLNEAVQRSFRLLRRVIPENISFEVSVTNSPSYVEGDESQVDQVILNLVLNARDAMPDGGKLSIELRDCNSNETGSSNPPPNGQIELIVSDSGFGIPPELHHKIFEPFFTTKEVGKGTGLGLAVVHGIISQMGGQISVDSSSQGSHFRILFPRSTQAPSLQIESKPVVVRGAETVLLVEDEDAVRLLLQRSLENCGYKVLSTAHSIDAIELMKKHQNEVAVVVTDLILPEIGGSQLASKLREISPKIRVIFISGYSDEAVQPTGITTAADAFLQKPFTPNHLAETIRTVLQPRRS